MSTITVKNEHNYPVDTAQLKASVSQVIQRFDIPQDSGVTIVLTTDGQVQALNTTHRDIEAPTDVLSFPSAPLPPELVTDEAPYLGDLIIAYPYASEQAKRLQHNVTDSLILLAVHGTLHLLGYDHDTPENRAAMWAEQAAVLQKLGIDLAIVPSLEESDHA